MDHSPEFIGPIKRRHGEMRADGYRFDCYQGPQRNHEARWCSPSAWSNILAYQKSYRNIYKRELGLAHKAYRSAHPELLDYWRRYNAEHAPEISVKKKAYHITHADERSAYMHDYHQANPHISRTNNIKRKKRELTDPAANSAIIRQFYLLRDRVSRCLGIPFHVDHVLALARGGRHHESNLQVIPASLNLRKHTQLV